MMARDGLTGTSDFGRTRKVGQDIRQAEKAAGVPEQESAPAAPAGETAAPAQESAQSAPAQPAASAGMQAAHGVGMGGAAAAVMEEEQ